MGPWRGAVGRRQEEQVLILVTQESEVQRFCKMTSPAWNLHCSFIDPLRERSVGLGWVTDKQLKYSTTGYTVIKST